MSTTQAQERTAIVKASSERVRAWLVSGCAGEPPLIDIAAMRELVEMMLAAPPPSAAPGAAHVATVLPGNGFLAEVPNGLPPGTRLYTAAPVGRAGQVQGRAGPVEQSAGEQTGPVPARPAPDLAREVKNNLSIDGHIDEAFQAVMQSREPDATHCVLVNLAHTAVDAAFAALAIEAAATDFQLDQLFSVFHQLGEDTALLDYIEREWFYLDYEGCISFGFNECWDAGKHATLRDAIRAARKGGK